ncbi:MAG: hypothetical protein R2856_04750 [Caldilineaceae bacterium]
MSSTVRKTCRRWCFWCDIGFILIGITGLLMGANWLVQSATFLARYFGISELVIGLTLVAVGTSLPELATSVVAIIRKEGDTSRWHSSEATSSTFSPSSALVDGPFAVCCRFPCGQSTSR